MKTHQVNTLDWPEKQIPPGVVPTGEKWSLGLLPKSISEQVFNQVRENAQAKQLQTTRREEFFAADERAENRDKDKGRGR